MLNFRRLAQLLGSDRPFWGLQAPGLSGNLTEAISIESMARLYCEEIKAVQRSGPYLLGGASFGAFIAFEMARLLTANGEEVGFLGIFDQYPPGSRIGYEPPDIFRQMICHLEILQNIPFKEVLPYVAHRVKSVLQNRKKEIMRCGSMKDPCRSLPGNCAADLTSSLDKYTDWSVYSKPGGNFMPKQKISCADVMPGCNFEAEAETESELLKKVSVHAAEVHGVQEVTPDLVAKVKSVIKSAE